MTLVEKKLLVYESHMNNKITDKERDILLETVDDKDIEVSIPELSFIKGKIKYHGKKEYLEDKDLLKKINQEYNKMLPQMKVKLLDLMNRWELRDYGIKSWGDLERHMTLDLLIISKFNYEGGGYHFTLWYNNEPKHGSKEFFENHSFRAMVDMFDHKPTEYEFSL